MEVAAGHDEVLREWDNRKVNYWEKKRVRKEVGTQTDRAVHAIREEFEKSSKFYLNQPHRVQSWTCTGDQIPVPDDGIWADYRINEHVSRVLAVGPSKDWAIHRAVWQGDHPVANPNLVHPDTVQILGVIEAYGADEHDRTCLETLRTLDPRTCTQSTTLARTAVTRSGVELLLRSLAERPAADKDTKRALKILNQTARRGEPLNREDFQQVARAVQSNTKISVARVKSVLEELAAEKIVTPAQAKRIQQHINKNYQGHKCGTNILRTRDLQDAIEKIINEDYLDNTQLP